MARSETTKHPFDFERLTKGMWIEELELERVTFVKRTHPHYLRKLLKLRDLIEKNTGILSRVDGLRLRLMTDSEAMSWSIRQAKQASEKLERSAQHLAYSIDRKQLTEPERAVHEHAQRVIIAMADAQRQQKAKHARLFEFISEPPALLGDGEDED